MQELLNEINNIKKWMVILGENLITEDTIILMHNTDKSPYFGSRFGQDVEPAGYYATKYEGFLNDGWEIVELTYNNPLIVPVTDDTLVSWKYDLSNKYKAKKQNLSKKLLRLGYDVIITRYPNNETGEIIVLDTSKLKKLKTR